MVKRFDEYFSTHLPYDPHVWFMIVVSDGPDINHVYSFPVASAKEPKEDHIISTLGTPHVDPRYSS